MPTPQEKLLCVDQLFVEQASCLLLILVQDINFILVGDRI